jgi:short-subunit dehydrogenase
VIGPARAGGRTELHDLADEQEGRLEIELLDINEPNEIAALRDRLSGRRLDMLFVNAGTVGTHEFLRVMITNALSPMRVIEELSTNILLHRRWIRLRCSIRRAR